MCPFRLATGGWCPGCGGTRALRHLMRGDLAMSLTLNPFLLVVLSQAVALGVAFLAVPDKARAWFTRHSLRLLQANILIGLVIWAARVTTDRIPLPFEVAVPLAELWRDIF